MRAAPKRVYIAVLLAVLLLGAGYFAIRLSSFLHIFFKHGGVALTQEEVAFAHNGSLSDSRLQVIPKIIHQIFHNWKDPGNETMPSDWDTVRQSCIDLNPGWEYRLWTEKISRTFIEANYPWFLHTYDNFRYPVQRIDALRYFLMLHYGGIYIDLDNGCLANLDPLLYYPVWVTDGGHGALSNNILGAMPQHPFYQLLTDSIIRYAWNYPFPYVTISYATGQWFETAIWEKYHSQLPQPNPADVFTLPLSRVMMDMRPGAARWVFFFQGRGGTWNNWDNFVFGWIGSHLIYFVAIMLFVFGFALGSVCLLRCACRRYGGYKPVPQGRKRGSNDDDAIELG